MSRNRSHLFIAFVALWAAGCAAAPPAGRVIHQEGEAGKVESFVRLDPAKEPASFSHPAGVTPERMKEILSGVTVQWHAGLLSAIFSRTPRRAFTDSEASMLATHLSRALAEATPQEAAVFYLNAPETGESARVTSGGVYVRDDKLVLMLANYHYVVTWSDQSTGKSPVSPKTARQNPLYSFPEGDYRLIPGPGQTLLGGNPSVMGRLFGKPSRGLVVDMTAPAAMAEPAPERPAPPPPPPSPAVSTLEEKLRTLKKLHDDGLITDEDYEKKKQELLEAF
ncbi:MAG: SHOCT domain-containing protein [Nitrospirota bacterium]